MTTFETDIHYLGILANADSSIRHLEVPGFEIKTATSDEIRTLLHTSEGVPRDDFFVDLCAGPCFDHAENCFYVLTRRSHGKISMNEHGGLSVMDITLIREFQAVGEIISPLIERLRLYAEGNLGLRFSLFHFVHEGRRRRIGEMESLTPQAHNIYQLDPRDLPRLRKFLAETQIPLQDTTLELARHYLDWSYEAVGRGMEFLMLMTGMEVLFNRGKDQITYTISRYTAVLLGQTPDQSQQIFQRMKKLYSIRSDIVHKGDAEEVNDASIRELRRFLRESIKALLRLGLSKKDYCSKLDALGFGQPPAQ